MDDSNYILVYSENNHKATNKPYEITLDSSSLDIIKDIALLVHLEAGARLYPTVMYRKRTHTNKLTYAILCRLLMGIEHVGPSKLIIHFKNDNHLDLRKENMRLMTPGDYRKFVLEKKHKKSLTFTFSNNPKV